MPVDRNRYPANWDEISRDIRIRRARGRCEGSPAFPNCRAVHGEIHPETGARVVLTVAHLDHNPDNCAPGNLRAWCQRCHLTYDAALHAANAARTRAEKKRQEQIEQGQLELPGLPDM